MTPHEALFGTKPCVSFLKCFGAKVIAWVPTQEQPDKLTPPGVEGRLVGYVDNSTSMYQVTLCEHKVYCSVWAMVHLTQYCSVWAMVLG